jgi:uncharacterized protein CbrC (UPF0167 family)
MAPLRTPVNNGACATCGFTHIGAFRGIPYARHEVDAAGHSIRICPVCSAEIQEVGRKDFESFTGQEYSDHFMSEHACPDHRLG